MERGISGEWIERLFEHPDLVRMGHHQRTEDQNLGLGWLYYAIGRILRPRRAVVIGSWRGFVPLVIAKALADNAEPGEVVFIDPSLADSFWTDADRVRAWFGRFDIGNISHFRMTTQEFVASEHYRSLGAVGLVFVDGLHTREQAKFDYESFAPLLAPRGMAMFHDSMVVRDDKVYGGENAYRMGVRDYVEELKADPALQLFDMPFGSTGLTLLRKRDADAGRSLSDWLDGPP